MNQYLVSTDMTRNEDKSVKFKRLATKRVNNALNTIRLIGNLSNTNNYTFSVGDISIIFTAIDDELKLARSRFTLVLKRRKKIEI